MKIDAKWENEHCKISNGCMFCLDPRVWLVV